MRWSMLPVSIGVHAAVVIAVFIVPLGAADEWPVPAPLHALVPSMKTAPVPASLVPPAASRVRPAFNPVIPASIVPERDTPEPVAPYVPGIPIDGAINLDLGTTGLGTQASIAPPPAPLPPPPARVVPAGPIVVGQGVREPKKIVDVRPVYPEIARSVKRQGKVILEAVINERGAVERIRVLHSEPLLDRAAIDAVQAWRYTPTTLNGVPVSVLMTITINFTLQD